MALIGILFIMFLIINLLYFSYYMDTIIETNTKPNKEFENIISDSYDIDGIWLCTRYNNYYTEIIRNEDDPMYNLDIITPIAPMCEWESPYSKYTQELFKSKVEGKPLYMVIPCNYNKYILELLELNNIKIVDIVATYNNYKYLNPYNYINIVKIEFNNL